MITKEQAIEILKGDFSKVILSENESHSELFTEAFNMAVEALNGKDTNIHSKWIPCSERLPEEEWETYITTHEDGSVQIHSYVHKDGFVFNWDINQPRSEVIAWMPLPEAFKESED